MVLCEFFFFDAFGRTSGDFVGVGVGVGIVAVDVAEDIGEIDIVSVIGGAGAAEALGMVFVDVMGDGSVDGMTATLVNGDDPTANVGVEVVPMTESKSGPASRIPIMPAVEINTYRFDFGGAPVRSLERRVRTDNKDAESGPFCTAGSASLVLRSAVGGIDSRCTPDVGSLLPRFDSWGNGVSRISANSQIADMADGNRSCGSSAVARKNHVSNAGGKWICRSAARSTGLAFGPLDACKANAMGD